ncbi:hypothetical protein Vadar_033390 [Vaccinium darrowii]|uniref:Uncharacterized protein n=1 Tax=Vaccinium darrowii TaxID=229202 RepID=A0ACB7ZAC1_9ERIC|nr:hypothetical protein Vadar_033390 [Vaccinium darrowii]
MCEDNGFLMPLLDILLDKLRICKGISYAAVAAHVDKSGRRQLAAMLVEYKCSSTNHWRGRYRSRPALELFGTIQARPLACDLFINYGRCYKHEFLKDFFFSTGQLQKDEQSPPGEQFSRDGGKRGPMQVPGGRVSANKDEDNKNLFKLRKHLVTTSYVDDSVSQLDGEAKSAGITILGEMGLDPGIDHMMAMKIVNEAHEKRGRIKSFTSYCGGLPSPAAANNPLAYKFSWNPVGAILAGRNSATYRSHGERVHVDGNDLYRAAMKFRISDLPAFALECLPNRDSLTYGDIYGIGYEASTIFRGTLRYEGFSEIMETLARIGFFNTEPHLTLNFENRPTYVSFLLELLNTPNGNLAGKVMGENDVMEAILGLGLCQEQEIAMKTAKTIVFLGLHEEIEVPVSCKSALDVICLRMEERLAYSKTEQDMVLLHHEVEVEFPDGQPAKKHKATLLEFGRTENGKTTTAMASTVGITAAIGALLLLADKIKTRGVLRPIEPEVYVPALEILQAYGIKLLEKMD